MRILIENGAYSLQNLGDVAMLQVAVERLRNLWPNALLEIFTTSPEKLVQFCPNTRPLLTSGRRIWSFPLVGQVYKIVPSSWAVHKLSNLEDKLRNNAPNLAHQIIKLKLRNKPEKSTVFECFMDAIYGADLVVTSGGGYITDAFKQSAISAVDTLKLAAKLGKTTAMFGVGLGPFQDREVLAKVKAVCPLVDLIALREKRAGIPLLNSMGVPQDSVLITGDDAIELAYRFRNVKLGDGLGVNLRFSEYSNVNFTLIDTIKSALHQVAKQHDIPLLPAPISHTTYPGYEESDSLTIQTILKGYDDTSDGGQSLDTPQKVIEQIGRCRVVVTGSYHAGVFALSQGIPIVGLAKSTYYIDKFLGLADQFGVGCEIVLLNEPHLKERLVTSINNAWNLSEQLRPQLLEAAQQQINMGNMAYKRVYELVKS